MVRTGMTELKDFIHSTKPASEPALSIDGLCFSYASQDSNTGTQMAGNLLFSDASMCLPQGSFTLLTGNTGSGKTTLMRLIKPELAPTGYRKGAINVFGRETTSLSVAESSTMIGYVAQNPETQIVCDAVWHELAFGLENLGTSQEAMRRRVAEVAYFFGIEPWMHSPTASLSGGQKQILALASILVMQPKLLLLDEPTAQLDPIAEKNFLHALFRINRELGITVLVATHSPETMTDYATGALRLEDGKIEPTPLSAIPAKAGIHNKLQIPHDNATDSTTINCRDLFFRYSKEEPWVLRGFDLTVATSSIHAIVGGNGSGKSTLLNMMAKAIKPLRGRVNNLHSSSQAILPQNPMALFVGDTAAEELKEWQQRCDYSDEEIVSMVDLFNLKSALAKHPYDLSGGEQQKLALAKILLTKPKLLLLDEPTKGLDTSAKRELATTLLGLRAKGVTILMATHDLAFVSKVADNTTMIFDGQSACSEPTQEFFSNNIFYRLPRIDSTTNELNVAHEKSMREDESKTDS